MDIIMMPKKYVNDMKIMLVKWVKPPDQLVKINSDGSALSNPGTIGARGIIRDNEGNFLFAYATRLRDSTTTELSLRLLYLVLNGVFNWGSTRSFWKCIWNYYTGGLLIRIPALYGVFLKGWIDLLSPPTSCKIVNASTLLENLIVWLIH